jgi:DNA-binding Xre family transcriptional regulator
MLNLNLQHIFEARGINKPYSFLVNAGFTPHTATAIVSSSTKTFKLEHIELLCKVLVCEPNDLLLFTADKNEVLPANHPLLKLQHNHTEQNWRQTLATIPYNQLKELSKTIKKDD